MPTEKKKPNRTTVRFHGFSAIIVGLAQVVWFIDVPISTALVLLSSFADHFVFASFLSVFPIFLLGLDEISPK